MALKPLPSNPRFDRNTRQKSLRIKDSILITGAFYKFSRSGTNWLTFFEYEFAVDKNIDHAGGQLLRLIVSSKVIYFCRIEDDNVSIIVHLQFATLFYFQSFYWQFCQLVNGLLQRKHFLIS